MPELPEVKTVAEVLKKELLNKKITNIKIIYPKIIKEESLDLNLLLNKKLDNLKTKGKFLLFYFEDYILISHLRMEGKYFIKKPSEELVKHEHIIFTFNNNISLRYHDTRKFGRLELIKKEDLNKNKSISKLGPEPKDIDIDLFYQTIKKRNTPIKTILLNQEIISGLGNIYVNEVLFDSKINPFRKGLNITREETKEIINSSIKILDKATKYKGTTIKSYTSSLGVKGNYQQFLKVHMKENQLCPNCNNKIRKAKINGRSTYYCKTCQK